MTPEELRGQALAVIASECAEHERLVEDYRSAVASAHDAIRLRSPASVLWPAASRACDAECDFTGASEGPAGKLYDELGIPDCYEPASCPRTEPTSEWCREQVSAEVDKMTKGPGVSRGALVTKISLDASSSLLVFPSRESESADSKHHH